MFTCDEDIGADVTDMFNYLTGYSNISEFRKLLVAPLNLRDRFDAADQTGDRARPGRPRRPPRSSSAIPWSTASSSICSTRPRQPGVQDRPDHPGALLPAARACPD